MKEKAEGGRPERTDLQEDFSEDAIGLFPEHRREDNGDAIGRGLDVDDLLVAVVEGHEFALAGAGGLELLVLLES